MAMRPLRGMPDTQYDDAPGGAADKVMMQLSSLANDCVNGMPLYLALDALVVNHPDASKVTRLQKDELEHLGLLENGAPPKIVSDLLKATTMEPLLEREKGDLRRYVRAGSPFEGDDPIADNYFQEWVARGRKGLTPKERT
jgi:hypothetical protein